MANTNRCIKVNKKDNTELIDLPNSLPNVLVLVDGERRGVHSTRCEIRMGSGAPGLLI